MSLRIRGQKNRTLVGRKGRPLARGKRRCGWVKKDIPLVERKGIPLVDVDFENLYQL